MADLYRKIETVSHHTAFFDTMEAYSQYRQAMIPHYLDVTIEVLSDKSIVARWKSTAIVYGGKSD